MTFTCDRKTDRFAGGGKGNYLMTMSYGLLATHKTVGHSSSPHLPPFERNLHTSVSPSCSVNLLEAGLKMPPRQLLLTLGALSSQPGDLSCFFV